jgi:predicted nucleic acid-binding protein
LIYLDSSVALAQLFAEDRHPPPELWQQTVVSSRLLEYELWTRVHGRGLGGSHGEAVRELLARVGLLELTPEVLARAVDPFPTAIRTLDALHLASMEYLRTLGQTVRLASYDRRLTSAATALGIQPADL